MLPNRLAQTCASLLNRTFSTRPSVLFSNIVGRDKVHPEYASRTPEEIWAERSKDAVQAAERHPPANAYSGRSVRVHGIKVADAIRSVETILNHNKVRYYNRLRQRHEKRCEKLQRLRSERWRKQFAAAVRQKAHLVTKIRSRGA